MFVCFVDVLLDKFTKQNSLTIHHSFCELNEESLDFALVVDSVELVEPVGGGSTTRGTSPAQHWLHDVCGLGDGYRGVYFNGFLLADWRRRVATPPPSPLATPTACLLASIPVVVNTQTSPIALVLAQILHSPSF